MSALCADPAFGQHRGKLGNNDVTLAKAPHLTGNARGDLMPMASAALPAYGALLSAVKIWPAIKNIACNENRHTAVIFAP